MTHANASVYDASVYGVYYAVYDGSVYDASVYGIYYAVLFGDRRTSRFQELDGGGDVTWGDGELGHSWNPVSPLGALLVLPVPVDACSLLSFIFHLMIMGTSFETILEESFE